jgi:ligand-binding SRPBCC domain-containing protein
MPRTFRLDRTQFIPRPLEEAFAFFAEAENLERITPTFLHFHTVTPKPIDLRSGTLIEYRLKLFGVPFRWRTRIEDFTPPVRFVDVQLHGPYKVWRHTHEFAAEGSGARMTDRVEYQLPLGPLGSVAHALFVRRTLHKIFDYRNRKVVELLR